MGKRREITEEQVTELIAYRKSNKNKNIEKRIKALLLHAEGIKHDKIAEQTGFAKAYITVLVGRYCKHGLSAVNNSNYHGNNRNLTFEEEEELLRPFMIAAQEGKIVEISEIKRAYEEKIGRSLDKSHGHIYDILRRHGWRKVMPRSRHPKKASEEVIETSKKLTLASGK